MNGKDVDVFCVCSILCCSQSAVTSIIYMRGLVFPSKKRTRAIRTAQGKRWYPFQIINKAELVIPSNPSAVVPWCGSTETTTAPTTVTPLDWAVVGHGTEPQYYCRVVVPLRER